MKQYTKNPRKISDEQRAELESFLRELGDLSGVVHDLNSDQIIGGNQRSKVFDINQCKIEIQHRMKKPDAQGTVALGYVIWKGKRYSYRQVRWTPKQYQKANIVGSLSDHEITREGYIHPSVMCMTDGCDFHEFIKLEGWSPNGTQE